MKKLISFILSVICLVSLTACGARPDETDIITITAAESEIEPEESSLAEPIAENTGFLDAVLEGIDYDQSPFSILTFDGNITSLFKLPSEDSWAKKNRLTERLKAAKTIPSDLPENGVEPVFYSLNLVKRDETKREIPFALAFADGYLITTDRQVFKTDIRMDELMQDFSYTEDGTYEPLQVSRYPAFAFFLRDDRGFRKEWLSRDHAQQFADRENQEGIDASVSLEKWENDGIVTVTFTNNSLEELIYGPDPFFAVLVRLDGEWYDVPYSPRPGYSLYSMLVGHSLMPGESISLEYAVTDYYPPLPAGEYRIIQMDALYGYYDFSIGS